MLGTRKGANSSILLCGGGWSRKSWLLIVIAENLDGIGETRGDITGGRKLGGDDDRPPYVMVGLSKELRWYDDALRQGFVALKRNTREINSTKHLSSIPGRSCDQCSIAKMGSWNFALPNRNCSIDKSICPFKSSGFEAGSHHCDFKEYLLLPSCNVTEIMSKRR